MKPQFLLLLLILTLLCIPSSSYTQQPSPPSNHSGRNHNDQNNSSSRQQQQPRQLLTLSASSSSSRDNVDANPEASSAKIAAADQYLSPFSLKLMADDVLKEFGRGVQSLVDRPVLPNEAVIFLEIPVEDTILSSSSTAAATTNAWLERIQKSLVVSGQEERLVLQILDRRMRGEDPYVTHVFPQWHAAIWSLPSEIWDELILNMCLPRCYLETFQATRDRVRGFCKRLVEAQQVGGGEEEANHSFSLEDCLWAFSMVRSRSVAVPELQPALDSSSATSTNNSREETSEVPLVIIPGLDLLNHQFESGTQLQLIEERNENTMTRSWVLSSTKTIRSGDQVFLSYGDDKDNWKLLLTYGFAVPENPNSLVFWTWQDLLEAANRVRPRIFPDRVVTQLMRHPQLEAYIALSEDRATFSFDAKRKEPRESLSNGLAMLSNLVVQLGQPADDNLPADVLDDLIRSRVHELRECQVSLTGVSKNILEEAKSWAEWKPLLDSLRRAIEQEVADLIAVIKD